MSYNSPLCNFDFWNPRAQAMDDRMGVYCMHYDLVNQKRYAGNGTVSTNILVYKRFVDELNPQEKTPKVFHDPVPIKNPRPSVIKYVD